MLKDIELREREWDLKFPECSPVVACQAAVSADLDEVKNFLEDSLRPLRKLSADGVKKHRDKLCAQEVHAGFFRACWDKSGEQD